MKNRKYEIARNYFYFSKWTHNISIQVVEIMKRLVSVNTCIFLEHTQIHGDGLTRIELYFISHSSQLISHLIAHSH